MTTNKPDYFDVIRQKALKRWQQLEQDRELAAPWHQLFKQVQSPRHVLSELLQNADDAEATEVTVQIRNGIFSFSHNGKDFDEEDFASLCRFGYSNKRLLRTIGFRGIGFKSTFSLGDTVRLCTPSLTVAFNKKRFTLPDWFDGEITTDGSTRVLVEIGDYRRQQELEINLLEWLNSPFSLLFFKHIRHLKLSDHDLYWRSLGEGPTPGSEWMNLQDYQESFLVVRSAVEPFPEEALNEIREERLLEMGENKEFPPCMVEIVLGAPGHFFVVLPTGLKTALPFAVNAPFVQDPARLKVKDPEISHTNRWLLQRIGELASETMLQWLEREDLDISERAAAYDLLPSSSEQGDSLEGACEAVIEAAFAQALLDSPYVLTDDGGLEIAGRCASVPPVLWDIWNGEQIATLLSTKVKDAHLLSRCVDGQNQQKLQEIQAVLSIEQDDILSFLTNQTPPRPTAWASVLKLWKLASQWRFSWKTKDLNIHPVRGKNILYSAKNLVRLGEKKLLQSEEDWDFLAGHLLVLDVNWLRYLTEQRRIAQESDEPELRENIAAADQMLISTGLDKPSNVDAVMEQVAIGFFARGRLELDECIRIAQITAKLNAKIGGSFLFCTRDEKLKLSSDLLLFDETGKLEGIIPPEVRESVLLHDKYFRAFTSCSREDWLSWIRSGNAGIKTFAPIHKLPRTIWSDEGVEKEVRARGYAGSLYYPYVTSHYEIDDWDFSVEYWRYWASCSQDDSGFWSRLVELLLMQPIVWENARSAQVFQIATTGRRQLITGNASLLPNWLLELRDLPCLRDTRGRFRRPIEMMYRTPQTEPLMDIEPFVDARLDTESTRPLLGLLGVRSMPTGPRQILERLRTLAQGSKPLVLELIKWYQRLDALFDDCSTEDQQEIKSLFRNERLIYAEDRTWQTTESAYITADDNNAPGAALINSSASQLSLWGKIGVIERPTVELAIQWLKNLPSGEKPSPTEVRRVKALLGRHSIRIWQDCGHWLNLAGEWVSNEDLRYALTMQSLIPWSHFHEWVKSVTADLQMLSAELIQEPPFVSRPSLASQVEKRLEKPPRQGRLISLPWLQVLGRSLTRICLEDETQTQRVRDQATRLAKSESVQVETISTVPYLNGNPAGLPEKELLAWVDQTLYMTNLPLAKLARLIPERIARAFDWPEMETLLTYSFERSEGAIRAYLEENFTLAQEEALPSNDGEVEIIPKIEELPENHEVRSLEGDSSILSVQSNEQVIEVPPQSLLGENMNETPASKPHPARPQPIRLPLIERFALAQGFRMDGLQQFVHSNGSVLMKSDGTFPWLTQEPGGKVLRYYWPKEHCLETKPLTIPTEIWHLIEGAPQQHALILEDRNGNPIQMLGSDLLTSKQHGILKLYPAAYRLTLEIED